MDNADTARRDNDAEHSLQLGRLDDALRETKVQMDAKEMAAKEDHDTNIGRIDRVAADVHALLPKFQLQSDVTQGLLKEHGLELCQLLDSRSCSIELNIVTSVRRRLLDAPSRLLDARRIPFCASAARALPCSYRMV